MQPKDPRAASQVEHCGPASPDRGPQGPAEGIAGSSPPLLSSV